MQRAIYDFRLARIILRLLALFLLHNLIKFSKMWVVVYQAFT